MSPSVKPTMIITNNETFWALDRGKLCKAQRRGTTQTTRRYLDSAGRTRFAGTKRLKESQNLGKILSQPRWTEDLHCAICAKGCGFDPEDAGEAPDCGPGGFWTLRSQPETRNHGLQERLWVRPFTLNTTAPHHVRTPSSPRSLCLSCSLRLCGPGLRKQTSNPCCIT